MWRRRAYHTLNRLELDRSALLHNYDLFKRIHSDQSVIPIIKANAYGHGLTEVATMLNAVVCPIVAVDGYFEADRIKDITKHRILVMGYIKPENASLLNVKKCSFVVQDAAGLKALAKLNRQVRIHMELNTGMNRLGLSPEEIPGYLSALARYPNLILEGIMSHLADADSPDPSFNDGQVRLFDKLVDQILAVGFSPKLIHLAATAGAVKSPSRNANAARIGIGLYGVNPLPASDPKYQALAGLKPVLAFKSTIIKVVELRKGDKVSYNGTFTAPRTMRLGILPAGYYEGIPRELSNVGEVTYQDKHLPIVGRVCMNHTMIDLRDSAAQAGDEVTIFSRLQTDSNSINNIVTSHDLSAYVLLTKIASSVRRQIV